MTRDIPDWAGKSSTILGEEIANLKEQLLLRERITNGIQDNYLNILKNLNAVIDALPHTGDGVPIVPPMNIIYHDGTPGTVTSIGKYAIDVMLQGSERCAWLPSHLCFSTYAAAKAASKNPGALFIPERPEQTEDHGNGPICRKLKRSR